jgi:type VI secretion system protein ImpL
MSASQAADILGILGGPTSPLKGLLVTVEANTNMSKPAEGGANAASLAASAEKAVSNSLTKLFGSGNKAAAAPTAAEKITVHFAQVDALVTGPPGGAPIDRVIQQIGQVQQKISSVGTGTGETSAIDAMKQAGQGEAFRALQLQAQTLPAPIGAMVAEIGGRTQSIQTGQARGQLDQLYRELVKTCEPIVSGRYPFSPSSAVDVPPADFSRLFGAGGIFDSFFKANLASQVDTTRTPWVWLSGGTGPAGSSTSMLRQFETVQSIRDNYLNPSGQLEQQFTLTPGDLDAGSTRFTLELDGQTLDYRHGPVRSQPFRWPGPAPGAGAVTFEDKNGSRPLATFQGPWAWFRMLDAATIRQESDVRFIAAFQGNGHQGTVVIEAPSIRNPYRAAGVRGFRCNAG